MQEINMKKHSGEMQSLVERILNQHKDITIDSSFHFLRVSGLLDYYLDTEFPLTVFQNLWILSTKWD
jgi:hypothetical protein